MGRRLRIGLLAFALVTVLANGCGGSSSSNGEAAKSAAAVFTDARHAALGATSVHVAGALTLSGSPLSLDLVLAQRMGKGTMSESGLSFQIIRIGNAAYIKGSDAFLKQFCRKLLGYALGRAVQLSDRPLLSEVQRKLEANDYRISTAIETIVQSRQFREIRGREFAAED